VPEVIAGIALPEGRPGAAEEVAATLMQAAAGFSDTAATVQRALAQVPSWHGVAALAYNERCTSYEQAAKAAEDACERAGVEVRRYGAIYDEAYARIQRLQREAEDCLERLKIAEREAAEAAVREQAARERATDAALRSPLDGGVSLAEHASALREADAAGDDRRRYEAQAAAEREELERLQRQAVKEHERIREAGREAAGAVRAATAEMPRVGPPPGAPGGGGAQSRQELIAGGHTLPPGRLSAAEAEAYLEAYEREHGTRFSAGERLMLAGMLVQGERPPDTAELQRLYEEPGWSRALQGFLDQVTNLQISLGPPGRYGAAVTGLPRSLRGLLGQRGRRVVRTPASTPVGRSGHPEMNVATPNQPTMIGGRDYSGHALDRMQGRGLTPTVVDDAIQHGRPRPGRGGTTVYHSGANNVTVVVNKNGRVITLRRGAP